MAILWVRKKTGAEYPLGSSAGKVEFSPREMYTVKSDVSNESPLLMLFDSRLPGFGSPHPLCPTAVCVKVHPVQNRDNPFLWDVTVEWNTNTDSNDPSQENKQPDQRRPKWNMNFVPMQNSMFRDLDGKPFVDKAGSIFNPPPNIPIFVDEVTIQRYEATCDRAADRAYMNGTNTDVWLGALANEALIANIACEEVFEQGAYWFNYTYKVLVNPRVQLTGGDYLGCWNPYQVLNIGTRELNDAGKPVPIKSEDDIYDGQPAPLDMSGHKLIIDSDGVIRNKDGVILPSLYYLEFRVVNTVAFGPLNLIPPWLW